ncbi:vacuolar protein sorting 55 [Lipomyces kononenkoae]|uniref:Vacuolar protein sorting 55 n=1 Tax=Lipomyces kononenkoae TaxID=34357 RepID=A0ACC3SUR9_LIPKO
MPSANPLSKIIVLASVLAAGFLLIILSCALFNNWLPLLVVGVFLIAPIPNAICERYSNNDDFMSEGSGNAVVDFGRYITGFFVVTGLALPVALAHSRVIGLPAMIMSIAGGLLVYGTIITFTLFFSETEEF